MSRRLALLAVLAALAVPCVHGQERKLQRDPFARPSFLELSERPVGSVPRAPRPATALDAKQALSLNAVLVAGADSLANVGGTLVRVGEFVHGYRLVEVHNRSAVFEKNKMRYTVELSSGKSAASVQPLERRAVPAAVGSDAR